MAEEQPTQQHPPQGGEQNVQLLLDEGQMKTSFVNAYRIHTTFEEVILDFGFNMPNPNPQTGGQQLLFRVTDRIIMSYPNLKRLSNALGQLVKRIEQQVGEIPINPQRGPQTSR